MTLDEIPPLDLPQSITPGYVPVEREQVVLTEAEREQLVHELVGFHPRLLCDDIANAAEDVLHRTVDGIEGWAQNVSSGQGQEVEREIDIGLHALETLFESQVDRAFDKFTAWILRNPFDVPQDVQVVLPWHKGLDFARGEYVVSLPSGEATLDETLSQLRTRVEQARLLSQRLEVAEKNLDRRLEIVSKKKEQVGFLRDMVEVAGLTPLPVKAETISKGLEDLHETLSHMDIPPPSTHLPPSGVKGETKAWEMGRKAYLSWAVGRMISRESGGGSEAVMAGKHNDGVDVSPETIDAPERLAKALGF
ncbi:hypothetical protein M231_03277 [Tremella mesenterica]|uniref:Kinetochore protein Mis12/MTW1 n=1 Tax=Tremella mesenterica TaxID=5217 RepID=A0A4Q1BNK5_TREME|nr:hypothetical protein M231_03277 [Tremella mesenterica]